MFLEMIQIVEDGCGRDEEAKLHEESNPKLNSSKLLWKIVPIHGVCINAYNKNILSPTLLLLEELRNIPKDYGSHSNVEGRTVQSW